MFFSAYSQTRGVFLHAGLFLWGWGVHDPLQSFPTRLVRGPSARPLRAICTPRPGPGSPTVGQLHGTSTAQRARQAVELLHGSLHPPPLDRRPPHSRLTSRPSPGRADGPDNTRSPEVALGRASNRRTQLSDRRGSRAADHTAPASRALPAAAGTSV